jgi:hypothetical protein
MYALLIIFAPLVALIVWGVGYDLKRRRRRLPITNADIDAARKAREAGPGGGAGGAGLPPSTGGVPLGDGFFGG